MSSVLRAKTDLSFLRDVEKTFGEGFISKPKIFGLPLGPKEVDTAKLTREISKKTIAHTAISPAKVSNFYKRAFTVCAASIAVAAIAYFSLSSL